MCYHLWKIVGLICFALAEYTIADPFFNQDVASFPYSDYSSFNREFNPGAVFSSKIVHQQQPDQLVSSFNPPQQLKAWPNLPKGFKSNQATGVVDSNPHPVLPAALAQQQTFPQVGSFNASQEEDTSPDLPQIKTPYHNQACGKSKSHFSDAVRAFASNFVQKIQPSPIYTDAFSLHNANPEAAVHPYYGYVYFLNKKKGDVDPEFAAYSATQAAKNNFYSMSTDLIEVHGYTVGQLLYETRQLTTENALKLSNEYFRATADSIDGVKVNTLKLPGVMAGVESFLSAYGVYSPGLAFTVPAVFCQVYYTLNENCS